MTAVFAPADKLSDDSDVDTVDMKHPKKTKGKKGGEREGDTAPKKSKAKNGDESVPNSSPKVKAKAKCKASSSASAKASPKAKGAPKAKSPVKKGPALKRPAAAAKTALKRPAAATAPGSGDGSGEGGRVAHDSDAESEGPNQFDVFFLGGAGPTGGVPDSERPKPPKVSSIYLYHRTMKFAVKRNDRQIFQARQTCLHQRLFLVVSANSRRQRLVDMDSISKRDRRLLPGSW